MTGPLSGWQSCSRRSTPGLLILFALAREPSPVSALAEATKLSQPLASQHLRLLRGINLVTATRSGRETINSRTDDHVAVSFKTPSDTARSAGKGAPAAAKETS